jgi:putative transcriptional regulator
MKIKHHPDLSMLMSCAAGSQPEAMAAVMASHLAVCPDCVRDVHEMEQIGAVLFEDLPAEDVDTKAAAMIMRGDTLTAEDNRTTADTARSPDADVPGPLRDLIGDRFENASWKWLAPGIWHIPIKLSDRAVGDLRLIKVAPGQHLPAHSHSGTELSLVLKGSYRDETGEYGVGDVADLDDDIEHAPVADADEGCICLIATEAPAKFKSRLARMIQPLTGL